MTWPVLPGCEPFSSAIEGGPARLGALVLHGFTGTPISMRPIGEALAGAGFDVELPRLPGHATHVDEMVDTRWADWYGEATRAYSVLHRRVERVVVVGLSMGGTLALTLALDQPVAGVVAINPLTRDRGEDVHELIDEMLEDGRPVVPGGPNDVADPDAFDPSYPATPLLALRSLLREGAAPLSQRLAGGTAPLRLFTSREDHVVDPADSEFLAAAWGGPVEHTWLDRSYHVATLDHDREIVTAGVVDFVQGLLVG